MGPIHFYHISHYNLSRALAHQKYSHCHCIIYICVFVFSQWIYFRFSRARLVRVLPFVFCLSFHAFRSSTQPLFLLPIILNSSCIRKIWTIWLEFRFSYNNKICSIDIDEKEEKCKKFILSYYSLVNNNFSSFYIPVWDMILKTR